MTRLERESQEALDRARMMRDCSARELAEAEEAVKSADRQKEFLRAMAEAETQPDHFSPCGTRSENLERETGSFLKKSRSSASFSPSLDPTQLSMKEALKRQKTKSLAEQQLREMEESRRLRARQEAEAQELREREARRLKEQQEAEAREREALRLREQQEARDKMLRLREQQEAAAREMEALRLREQQEARDKELRLREQQEAEAREMEALRLREQQEARDKELRLKEQQEAVAREREALRLKEQQEARDKELRLREQQEAEAKTKEPGEGLTDPRLLELRRKHEMLEGHVAQRESAHHALKRQLSDSPTSPGCTSQKSSEAARSFQRLSLSRSQTSLEAESMNQYMQDIASEHCTEEEKSSKRRKLEAELVLAQADRMREAALAQLRLEQELAAALSTEPLQQAPTPPSSTQQPPQKHGPSSLTPKQLQEAEDQATEAMKRMAPRFADRLSDVSDGEERKEMLSEMLLKVYESHLETTMAAMEEENLKMSQLRPQPAQDIQNIYVHTYIYIYIFCIIYIYIYLFIYLFTDLKSTQGLVICKNT